MLEDQKEDMEEELIRIEMELRLLGLELEPRKTECILLCTTTLDPDSDNDRNYVCTDFIPFKKEAKFLRIILDYNLEFKTYIDLVRDKMLKANNLLRYMNGIRHGMEVNTALIIYKVLIRAIFYYCSYIYFPSNQKARLKLERAQYQGLRIAMGYWINIPTNILLEETKIVHLRERALYLGKNLLARIMIYGSEEVKEKIRIMEAQEACTRLRNPVGDSILISTAWRRVRRDRGLIHREENYGLYRENYWHLTRKIPADVTTGYYCQDDKITDTEFIQKLCSENQMRPECKLFYMDGSKTAIGQGVGVALIDEDNDEGRAYSIIRDVPFLRQRC